MRTIERDVQFHIMPQRSTRYSDGFGYHARRLSVGTVFSWMHAEWKILSYEDFKDTLQVKNLHTNEVMTMSGNNCAVKPLRFEGEQE